MKVYWTWVWLETDGFNYIAKFESVLINFGLLKDYNDIIPSEQFDFKYGTSKKSDKV